MFEKIYTRLLRLYPSSFQKAYGGEALQLFRDRARDEKGFLSGVRLWLDLLSDLAVSVPRSYRTFAAVVAGHCYEAGPLFLSLEDEALSFGSLLCGVAASLLVYSAVLLLLAHGGGPVSIRVSDSGRSSPGSALASSRAPGFQQDAARALSPRPSAVDGDPTGSSNALAPGADIERKPLAFDVVSIHEDKSGSALRSATNGPTPDGYQMRGGPLLTLIQTAYLPSEGSMSFRLKQMTGLPTWAYSVLYDVDAKVSEADLPAWKDPALQPAMLRAMLQTMLADRFKFVVHRENKVVPIYDLTVGKRGPKFKPYDGATLAEIQQKHPGAHMLAGGVIAASGPNPGQQSFFGVTMSELGTLLSNLAGRPVLDKTGLKGRYDVTYQIELLPPPPQTDGVAPPPPSPDSDFFRSQISTIVRDQIGLKLKAGSAPVEVLVIDHVEKPSEN